MYKLNYFNFDERNNDYLITNDAGKYCFIDKNNFKKLMKKEKLDEDVYIELIDKGFIYNVNDEIFSNDFSCKVRSMKDYIFASTNLHIFVVSKNCNFRCIYCQAGKIEEKQEYKMSKEIAKKAVDIAMQTPSDYLTLEFQGGEPLTNFEVIKYIIDYSKQINTNKIIDYNLVSNLTLLDDEMLQYFVENKVMICTSIDGNKELQNINRPYPDKDSYEETLNRIKKIRKINLKINAIETTSKYSLSKYKEIVDEYIQLGLDSIALRPLTNLGKANTNWDKIGYQANEFLEFYDNTLKYIIQKNKEGKFITESLARIFLKKIFHNYSENYMELRSPCGAGVGQMSYYYDGNVYTCDEGRMLSEMGDNSFEIGNVHQNTYLDLIESDTTKAVAVASCLECIPMCNSCVYMPYCGTCPVLNLAQSKNIFPNYDNFRCKIYKGILNILFNYIQNDSEAKFIFEKWIN